MNTPVIQTPVKTLIKSSSRHTRQLINIALVVMAVLLAPVSAFAAQLVDINNADVETMIENWKGIGETKARAIVAYRKKNGKFKDIDDLANVKGIGEGLIKNNRKYMSVSKGVSKPTGKSSSSKSSSKKALLKRARTKNPPVVQALLKSLLKKTLLKNRLPVKNRPARKNQPVKSLKLKTAKKAQKTRIARLRKVKRLSLIHI